MNIGFLVCIYGVYVHISKDAHVLVEVKINIMSCLSVLCTVLYALLCHLLAFDGMMIKIFYLPSSFSQDVSICEGRGI